VIRSVDAVVIGAGAFGSSVAYHLARKGRKVALVERHDVASQTSPRAAGQTQQIRFDRHTSRMAIRSVRKILDFTRETGEPASVHQSGSVKLAFEPRWAEQVRLEAERGRALGIDVEMASASEAKALAPWVEPKGALAAWYTPSDLYVDPRDLPLGYARAAERSGATVLPRTTVTGIRRRNGAVSGVVTDRGDIDAPTVVDAAGAWAGVVAAMVGVRLPIVPTRHQLLVTRAIPGVRAEQPIVRILRDGSIYVRPERGGLLVGGYEDDPRQVDMTALPPTFEIDDLELDAAPLRGLIEALADRFPALADAEVAELRGGLPTMTPDGHHIFDEVGPRGFFVAAGCCVGGLSISPAVGEILAEWIVDGRPPVDMSWFALARFGPEVASDADLRAACLQRYAHHYETPARGD
jgi:glycine/D-amino acid oxidase-like deaminating enzyme